MWTRFERKLAADAEARRGAWIVDLKCAAVDLLYSDPEILLEPNRRKVRAAMKDIDQHTRGCAFRLDTPAGPLFIADVLWEYAGCSASCIGMKPGPDSPVWPVARPATSQALVAAA